MDTETVKYIMSTLQVQLQGDLCIGYTLLTGPPVQFFHCTAIFIRNFSLNTIFRVLPFLHITGLLKYKKFNIINNTGRHSNSFMSTYESYAQHIATNIICIQKKYKEKDG